MAEKANLNSIDNMVFKVWDKRLFNATPRSDTLQPTNKRGNATPSKKPQKKKETTTAPPEQPPEKETTATPSEKPQPKVKISNKTSQQITEERKKEQKNEPRSRNNNTLNNDEAILSSYSPTIVTEGAKHHPADLVESTCR